MQWFYFINFGFIFENFSNKTSHNSEKHCWLTCHNKIFKYQCARSVEPYKLWIEHENTILVYNSCFVEVLRLTFVYLLLFNLAFFPDLKVFVVVFNSTNYFKICLKSDNQKFWKRIHQKKDKTGEQKLFKRVYKIITCSWQRAHTDQDRDFHMDSALIPPNIPWKTNISHYIWPCLGHVWPRKPDLIPR